MDHITHIAQCDVFAGIPKEEIMRIARAAQDRTYSSKSLLYTANEYIDYIYIVKQGNVSLYHSKDGRRFVFDVVEKGGLFGNLSANDSPVSHNAEVEKGSRVCRFTVADFLAIVSEHPQVMLRTMKVFAERISDYIGKFEAEHANAGERILLELHRSNKKKKNLFMVMKKKDDCLKMTHEDIAKRTGLNRVTVTRALQQLESQGKVMLDKRGEICLMETM